jgi:hypothetical protein
VVADDGFDLMLEGMDLNNQVGLHAYHPARTERLPPASICAHHAQKDNLGIGFRGVVADIRQSERGETLALSLSEPERFLFELNAGKDGGGYGGEASEPSFVRNKDEGVGDVVSLDGKVIQNIVISNPQAKRLQELKSLLDAGGIPATPEEPSSEDR